jgi:hypothetical protein
VFYDFLSFLARNPLHEKIINEPISSGPDGTGENGEHTVDGRIPKNLLIEENTWFCLAPLRGDFSRVERRWLFRGVAKEERTTGSNETDAIMSSGVLR